MRIALLGDIALFGRCTTPDYFKDISEFLSGFDYVVGNLETPFSEVKKRHGAKSAYICAEPQCVSILNQIHINAVTLANNHMFDYGKEGYELTKRLLNDSGIEWFGSESKELHIDINGNKIAFAGYCCYTTNPLCCVKYGEYGVNAYNIGEAKSFITRSNSEGFLPIIAVHAGLEHVNYPSIDHIRTTRKLSSAGPYVYYGHHPHVIQGAEEYDGSLIAHSLGNFCFDDIYTDNTKEPFVTLTQNNRTGMILVLSIDSSRVVSWEERIIYISETDGIKLIERTDAIAEYNESLSSCEFNPGEYDSRRTKLLAERISERKSRRNFQWYLKRLKPRYVELMLNAKKNGILYKQNVLNYL